ncbi:hypothetical protein RI367_007449 [Sorochytrium milnesiophthora]
MAKGAERLLVLWCLLVAVVANTEIRRFQLQDGGLQFKGCAEAIAQLPHLKPPFALLANASAPLIHPNKQRQRYDRVLFVAPGLANNTQYDVRLSWSAMHPVDFDVRIHEAARLFPSSPSDGDQPCQIVSISATWSAVSLPRYKPPDLVPFVIALDEVSYGAPGSVLPLIPTIACVGGVAFAAAQLVRFALQRGDVIKL